MPDLEKILTQSQVIAVVGHSDKPYRTSYQIAHYLREVGYTVYAVNPTVNEIDGEPCYPDLQAIPDTIDIVNVFRRSEYLLEVVEEAIAVGAKVVWAQLGIYDDIAIRRAEAAGLTTIMDTCIKVAHAQLT